MRSAHARRRAAPAAVLAGALLALAACASGGDGVARAYTEAAAKADVRVAEPATKAAVPAAFPADPVPVAEPPAAEGVAFASLRVPRWGDDYDMPIHEGITDSVLDSLGMGRFPYSQMPGEEGNFAVAGHRTDGSRPLARVDTLQLGDELQVTTADGTYTYAVSGTEIVTPDQVRVVQPNPETGASDPVGHLLTFVTCHPWDSSEFRFIVYAELSGFQAA